MSDQMNFTLYKYVYILCSDNGDILLASAAQDFFIRIWRFSARKTDDLAKSVKDLSIDEEIKMRENTFSFKQLKGKEYTTTKQFS